jgi:hypothetical protein
VPVADAISAATSANTSQFQGGRSRVPGRQPDHEDHDHDQRDDDLHLEQVPGLPAHGFHPHIVK